MHSIVEDIAIKWGELQSTKRVKEFELKLAQFELSSELDRLYNHIQMIKDLYITGLESSETRIKYGQIYTEKIEKATK